MPDISVFDSVDAIDNAESMPLSLYLHEVQTGRWQDQVLQVRAISDKKRRDALKKSLPGVTFSGLFSKRKDDCLIQHSGVICIDLDDLGEDTEAYKEILSKDRYVYSAFTSVSGTGLRVLFRIAGAKHRESYYGISDYLRKNYGLVTDPQSMVPSRSFYITYDPYLYISEHNIPLFTDYPKEQKAPKIENFAFAEDDFFAMLKQVEERNINLCDAYQDWLKIGFAFSSKFGETGRTYFHMISQISEKYNVRQCDKQYDYCLKHKSMNVATIKTFYWYCQQAGLQITSERTQKIRKITVTGKSAGLRKEQIVANLAKEGITDADAIVFDVYDSNISVSEGSLMEQLEVFINSNYILKKNMVTRKVEFHPEARELEDSDFNTIYIAASKIIKSTNSADVYKLINSDFTAKYNPIHDYFEKFEKWKNPVLPHFSVADQNPISPIINKLSSTIRNDKPAYTEFFIRKWVVGIVSGAFGTHNPLVLVLTGRQNTGKTEWFRRLFPDELKKYKGESKLMAGKDDEILMTQKLLILDDEFSGKGKREAERFKELCSKQIFSLREPYAKSNTDLPRIATICGTTNEDVITSDSTGNRRLIPVKVSDIDKKLYNSINKNELFKEAYLLLNSGYDWRVVSPEDIRLLNETDIDFYRESAESELIMRWLEPSEEHDWLTSTDIKSELENASNIRTLNVDRIGKEMKRLNFIQKKVWDSLKQNSSRKWGIKKLYGSYNLPPEASPFK